MFGGTFDPIHIGHLAAAEAVRQVGGLELVIFVPNWQQPLKPAMPIASAAMRLAMLQLAIAGNPAFTVSDIELHREGPSFTIETLDALAQHYPGEDLHFLLGADALNQLARWREPHRILTVYRPIVMLRAGWPGPDLNALDQIVPGASDLVQVVEVPALDIASSALRARIAVGRSIRYLVPDAVRELIEQHGLYHRCP